MSSPSELTPEGVLRGWHDRPRRVLFLRDDRIGDMIASLAVIEAIGGSPGVTVDVLASPSNARLARGRAGIRDVLVKPHRSVIRSLPLYRELRRRGYDAVIDGRVFVGAVSLRRRLLMRATGARWRIGIAGRKGGGVYNVPLEPPDLAHWIDYIVALARPVGVEGTSRSWRPRLSIPDEGRVRAEERWRQCRGDRPRVLVNLSAGSGDRRWPDDRWAALLQHVRFRLPDARVAIIGMPHDQASGEALATLADGAFLMIGLDDAMAMVATTDLLISPDTAITHVASAFETPALTLLRRGFEKLVPYRTPGRNVYSEHPLHVRALPVDRVIRAFEEIAAERKLGAVATG
jgi:ADP-heptose:LPS heptosyltransferase